MNARRAKLAAEILFDKLKPLINYQDLSRWHRAYDLRELLEVNGLPSQFNSLFSELDTSPINIKNEKNEILASSYQGNYYISRTSFDSSTGKKIFLKRIILERDGRIVKKEKKTFDPTSESLMRHEIIDASNKKVVQTVRVPKPGSEEKFYKMKKSYVFSYHSEYRRDLDKFLWELEIQENTRFFDPLSLESALFFPDKLSFDPLDIKKLRKNLEFYVRFSFLDKGSGVNYVKNLLGVMLRVKPFKQTVDFVKEFEKKNNLLLSN